MFNASIVLSLYNQYSVNRLLTILFNTKSSKEIAPNQASAAYSSYAFLTLPQTNNLFLSIVAHSGKILLSQLNIAIIFDSQSLLNELHKNGKISSNPTVFHSLKPAESKALSTEFQALTFVSDCHHSKNTCLCNNDLEVSSANDLLFSILDRLMNSSITDLLVSILLLRLANSAR